MAQAAEAAAGAGVGEGRLGLTTPRYVARSPGVSSIRNVPVDWAVLQVIIVLFVATLVRSSLGFGEALFAVPLLAMTMPVEEAAPLAVLVSITVAFLILLQDWRSVHARSAGWLVVFTLLGIPLGLLLLRTVSESAVKGILGAIIIAFYGGPQQIRLRHHAEIDAADAGAAEQKERRPNEHVAQGDHGCLPLSAALSADRSAPPPACLSALTQARSSRVPIWSKAVTILG